MTANMFLRRDTQVRISQVRISLVLALALALCLAGITNLTPQGTDRALMATSFLFCLSSAFTLAKTLRDDRDRQVDTQAWMVQAWTSFGISNVLVLRGLVRIDVPIRRKLYRATAWVFLLSASFTLAKTVRDNH